MRRSLLAAVFCLAASLSADAEPRASSPDDITRALGGDYWKPMGERRPSAPSAADAAKRAPREHVDPIVAPEPSAGTDLPIYDVEARCRRLQRGAEGICIDAEQRDYDFSRLLWSGLSPEQQAKCASYVQQPDPRRYAAVQGCVALYIDMNDIQRRQATNKFRY